MDITIQKNDETGELKSTIVCDGEELMLIHLAITIALTDSAVLKLMAALKAKKFNEIYRTIGTAKAAANGDTELADKIQEICNQISEI